jgi:hypothetical protein
MVLLQITAKVAQMECIYILIPAYSHVLKAFLNSRPIEFANSAFKDAANALQIPTTHALRAQMDFFCNQNLIYV